MKTIPSGSIDSTIVICFKVKVKKNERKEIFRHSLRFIFFFVHNETSKFFTKHSEKGTDENVCLCYFTMFF